MTIRPMMAERGLADLLHAERYIVVGANSGGDTVSRFLNARGKSITAYTDFDRSRAGGVWNGKPIIALDEVPSALDGSTAVIIGSIRHSELGQRLVHDLGVDPEKIYPFVNDMFARHYEPDLYRQNAGKIARVRSMLADEDSKSYFDRVIDFYRTLDPRLLVANPKSYGLYGYHAPDVKLKANAVIVDVGAFNGDSCAFYFEETAGTCFIYAIEAYMPNFMHLMKSLAGDPRVKPLHLALGAETGTIVMDGNPEIADSNAHRIQQARDIKTTDIVLCETLDRVLSTHIDARIDHIKIDVEGGDLDVLIGGERILRRDRPSLAVASYHTPHHIWDIPLKADEYVGPCRIYAGHDPKWVHQIHYLVVPERDRA